MKKITLIFALLLAFTFVNAQSQRMVFFEEFTQASCGPCAATNPGLKTLLDANNTKVVSLKYQTDWPGVDPMNVQNPTEVDNRVTYYSVTGVPDGEIDGNVFNDHPANLTQAIIDGRYAVPSPFTLAVSHSLSSDYDSIFITCDITCTQNVTGTTMKLRVAVTEDEIEFCSPPGTNGEKEFYGVMRKMLPSDAGTALAAAWTSSQTQTVTFAVPLPTYLYDKNQIGVVAFIQDDNTKEVHQCAKSVPQPLFLDAGLKDCSPAGTFYQCSTSYTPTVVIHNFGSTALTSCTISYKIDAGTPQSFPWTGTIAPGATASVTLPVMTATAGTHTFSASTLNPNTTPDHNNGNDAYSVPFAVGTTPVAAPLTEGFASATFPPANWAKSNPDNGATWTRVTTAGVGATLNSAKMDFYTSPAGQVDELYLAKANLAGSGNAVLTFDVAYAPFNTTLFDKLEVFASTDCGANWSNIYSKENTDLATAAATTSSYVPATADWRHDDINMNTYIGQSDVLIKFTATSGYGNNLYLDNINLYFNTGVASLEGTGLSLFPNPSNGMLYLETGNNHVSDVKVTNVLGEVVASYTFGNFSGKTTLDLSVQPAGIYSVNIISETGSLVQKVVVSK